MYATEKVHMCKGCIERWIAGVPMCLKWLFGGFLCSSSLVTGSQSFSVNATNTESRDFSLCLSLWRNIALAWKRKLNRISTKPQAFSSQLTPPYVFQTLTHVWSVKLFIDLWSPWVSYHFRAVNLMCLLSFVNDLCGVCVCMCCVSICERCQCVEPCHRV